MYSIGYFLKKRRNNMGLRYYDEKLLLKPSYVSPSGRRYYKDEDIETLQKIITFKCLGYSLEDILPLITEKNIHHSLIHQRQEIIKKKRIG